MLFLGVRVCLDLSYLVGLFDVSENIVSQTLAANDTSALEALPEDAVSIYLLQIEAA